MSIKKVRVAMLIVLGGIALVFAVFLVIGLLGPSPGEKIGVVEIDGVITDSKEAVEDIIRFKTDRAVGGVILRINSPGGAVAPTQEIFREVQKLRERKKVYVSMGAVCASGGYYIATAGEKVFANPSTITGSIGVIMEQPVVEDLLRKIGVYTNTLKAGDLKDAGTPFRKMTESERIYFTSVLQEIHGQFIKDVAAGRRMSVDVASKLADGRIFTGNQAKNLGLIDTIGSFYDTVDGLKEALNVKGEATIVYGKRPFSLMRMLIGSLSREIASRLLSGPFQYRYDP
jgi:protease-4